MGAQKCTCGTWNSDQARFCRNCGTKLVPKPNNTNSVSTNQKSNISSTNTYSSSSTSSSSEMGTGGKLVLSVICIAAFIGISVATGGIGSISAVVLYPAFKQIWNW